MSDIEGAICDECGSKIGPYGCCGTARHQSQILDEHESYEKHLIELLQKERQRSKSLEQRSAVLVEALTKIWEHDSSHARCGCGISYLTAKDALKKYEELGK